MQNSQNTFSKEDYLKKAKQILEVALFLYTLSEKLNS